MTNGVKKKVDGKIDESVFSRFGYVERKENSKITKMVFMGYTK